jgi:hypothetical protein
MTISEELKRKRGVGTNSMLNVCWVRNMQVSVSYPAVLAGKDVDHNDVVSQI